MPRQKSEEPRTLVGVSVKVKNRLRRLALVRGLTMTALIDQMIGENIKGSSAEVQAIVLNGLPAEAEAEAEGEL
jgi:hypothetical protein